MATAIRDGPNPDSKILKIAQETYKRLFNKDAKIMAIHAGLECGLFLEKYPKLDMISFGRLCVTYIHPTSVSRSLRSVYGGATFLNY